MNLEELRTEVRAVMGDVTGTARLATAFADDQVDDAINWAIGMLATRTKCTYQRLDITQLTYWTAYIPNNCLSVEDVSVSGAALESSSPRLEALLSRTWRTDLGTPRRWFQESGSTLRIAPGGSATITLGYVAKPDDLEDDADEVDSLIPTFYQTAIPYGAAARLRQIDGDTQDIAQGQALMGQFDQLIAGAKV